MTVPFDRAADAKRAGDGAAGLHQLHRAAAAAPQFVSHLPFQTPALAVGTGVFVAVGVGVAGTTITTVTPPKMTSLLDFKRQRPV